MKYYLYNPLSRNKKAKERINFNKLNNYYDSTNENDVKALKKELSSNDIISIIGGDGTLHYILNNFDFVLNKKIEYYKNGSGNDFYSSLANHSTSFLYTINKKHRFINSFGIGFDALICLKVNSLKNKSKLSYIKQAYQTIKEYQPFDIEVEYNDKKHIIKNVWLCSLQNGKYFGGGIKIAKNARIDQEDLQLCIAHNLKGFQVLLLLFFVKLGMVHLFKKYFYTVSINNIKIFNKKKIIAQFDGDVVELNQDIVLTDKKTISIKKGNEF